MKHGPKRLRPMRGYTFNAATGKWEPKFKKPLPDQRDRAKLEEKLKQVKNLPAPTETPAFALGKLRLLEGHCLLEFGPRAEMDGGVVIPQAQRSNRGVFKIVKADRLAECAPGDFVLLDGNAHQKIVKINDVDYFITHRNSIAAIVET